MPLQVRLRKAGDLVSTIPGGPSQLVSDLREEPLLKRNDYVRTTENRARAAAGLWISTRARAQEALVIVLLPAGNGSPHHLEAQDIPRLPPLGAAGCVCRWVDMGRARVGASPTMNNVAGGI